MTHAVITPSGENVLTAESGNVVIWDLAEKQVQISQLQVKSVPSILFLVKYGGSSFLSGIKIMVIPVQKLSNY